jgi:hypothetical protein
MSGGAHWLQCLAAAYPQTPVALMCRSTSPWPGAYTGASTCFKLWSAVTCSEGFGSGVDSVFFPTIPFVAYALELADMTPSGGVDSLLVPLCLPGRFDILHYEIEKRGISNATRDDEGGMTRAQERLHLHASQDPCGGRIAECSGGWRGRSLHKLSPLDQEYGAYDFHLEQAGF